MKNRLKSYNSDELANRIAANIIRGQRKIAVYLDSYPGGLTKTQRVYLLVLFIILFGGYNVCLLIRGLH